MYKTTLKTVAAISLILIGSGCATPEVVTVPMELTRPARPVLPRLEFDEVRDIAPATWQKIVQRDLLRRQYAEQLETIIDSTKP